MGRIIPIDQVIAQETTAPSTRRRITPIDELIASERPTALQRTEQKIASRESLIPAAGRSAVESIIPSARRNVMDFLNPAGGLVRRGINAALQVAASQEMLESAQANPLLALQRGRPQDVFVDLVKGLRGQRVAERGDVLRAAGAPEPVAASVGLLTSPETALPVLSGITKTAALGKAGIQGTLEAGQEMARLGRPSTILKPSPFREVLISRVQNRLLNAPKLAGHEFESGLNEVVKAHPTQRVDLSGSLENYMTQAGKNPAFKTLINRQALNSQESGLVQLLIHQPAVASNLTLQESQMVKQIFQRAIKSKFKEVSPEFFGAHLDALEVWHDIRAAQLSAFPKFEKVLKGYAETLSNFRVIKNILKEGALEPKLLSNLNNNTQLITAFRELATPDTLRMVKQLLRSNATRSFLMRLGLGAAGTTAIGMLGYAGYKTFGKPTVDVLFQP